MSPTDVLPPRSAECRLTVIFFDDRIRNIYPVLAGLDSKLPRLLVIAIVVLHAAIALTFKIVFFSSVQSLGLSLSSSGSPLVLCARVSRSLCWWDVRPDPALFSPARL